MSRGKEEEGEKNDYIRQARHETRHELHFSLCLGASIIRFAVDVSLHA